MQVAENYNPLSHFYPFLYLSGKWEEAQNHPIFPTCVFRQVGKWDGIPELETYEVAKNYEEGKPCRNT